MAARVAVMRARVAELGEDALTGTDAPPGALRLRVAALPRVPAPACTGWGPHRLGQRAAVHAVRERAAGVPLVGGFREMPGGGARHITPRVSERLRIYAHAFVAQAAAAAHAERPLQDSRHGD